MKRILYLFIVIFALSLSSCTNIHFLSKEEMATLSNESIKKEEEDGLLTLLSDLIREDNRKDISPSSFVSILPSSYVLYEEYVPSYPYIRDRYLSHITNLVNDVINREFYFYIQENGSEIIKENSSTYIKGGVFLSKTLKDNLTPLFVEMIENDLNNNADALEEAFNESKKTFNSVRISYSNLEKANKDISLLPVSKLDNHVIAIVATSIFFSELNEREEDIRNNPSLSFDSPYSVFWKQI